MFAHHSNRNHCCQSYITMRLQTVMVSGMRLAFACTVFDLAGAFSVFVPRAQRLSVRLGYLAQDNDDEDSALTWEHDEQSKQNAIQYIAPTLWLMEEEEDSWKEWHFSFSRNGFTDYLPQFSGDLNCLLVGGTNDHANRLPWEEEQHSRITKLLLKKDSDTENAGIVKGPSIHEMVATTSSSLIHVEEGKEEYDCILDRGLANAMIMSISKSNGNGEIDERHISELNLLMEEASRAICDMGIYVMLTNELLSPQVKEYLTEIGTSLGMLWEFDLDGISSSEKGMSVSIARKYFHGELPSFQRGITTHASHHTGTTRDVRSISRSSLSEKQEESEK
mmetsp:Transcript_17506/g.31594  ORF Transcript_17506/g.31594 Transcript_17506/m.31594 type:complete len:335 (-) Transcript_17506:761-1765(-)